MRLKVANILLVQIANILLTRVANILIKQVANILLTQDAYILLTQVANYNKTGIIFMGRDWLFEGLMRAKLRLLIGARR